MNNDSKIDDLVSMIDQFMSNDGGHMNVDFNISNGSPVIDKNVKNDINIQTARSLDCSNGQMACQVPTLHEGIDE